MSFISFDEIVVVQVMGSVENERTFSTLTFMKTRLKYNLKDHLGSVMRMFYQPFWRLDNFSLDEAYTHW